MSILNRIFNEKDQDNVDENGKRLYNRKHPYTYINTSGVTQTWETPDKEKFEVPPGFTVSYVPSRRYTVTISRTINVVSSEVVRSTQDPHHCIMLPPVGSDEWKRKRLDESTAAWKDETGGFK